MAESPLEAGTIWVGADDGLVHITRDDGATWTDVTPDGMAEGMVNSLDPSPHEPGGAYITLSRYKFNDFTPYIYKTTDYGESWARIDAEIAADRPEAWARIVREDPERRGLLYAGTELGMYVSFDDGTSWRSLDLNMPLTSITDLRVQAGDLAAATQGRGFWVLDDLSPLRQEAEAEAAEGHHLYTPSTAYRVNEGLGGAVGPTATGQNKTPGVAIDYVMGGALEDETPALEILDAAGAVIRTFSTDTTVNADGIRYTRAPAGPGHNRVFWDLRVESGPRIAESYSFFGDAQGYRVIPGRYSARLAVGEGPAQTREFEVRGDPRVPASQTDFAANRRFLESVFGVIVGLHGGVNDIRDVRSQVKRRRRAGGGRRTRGGGSARDGGECARGLDHGAGGPAVPEAAGGAAGHGGLRGAAEHAADLAHGGGRWLRSAAARGSARAVGATCRRNGPWRRPRSRACSETCSTPSTSLRVSRASRPSSRGAGRGPSPSGRSAKGGERVAAGGLAIEGGPPVRTAPWPSWPRWGAAERRALLEVLESGRWGRGGRAVPELEARFAALHGARYAVACCNGTVAIQLGLIAAGVRPGDEVITSPYSFRGDGPTPPGRWAPFRSSSTWNRVRTTWTRS